MKLDTQWGLGMNGLQMAAKFPNQSAAWAMEISWVVVERKSTHMGGVTAAEHSFTSITSCTRITGVFKLRMNMFVTCQALLLTVRIQNIFVQITIPFLSLVNW